MRPCDIGRGTGATAPATGLATREILARIPSLSPRVHSYQPSMVPATMAGFTSRVQPVWSLGRTGVRRGTWQQATPLPRVGAGLAADKRLAIALAECIRAAWERERVDRTKPKHPRQVTVMKENAPRGKAA